MMICVPFLAGASCQTIQPTESATTPCDVLVDIPTKPETNTYLIENDRVAAIGLARHKGRIAEFECPAEKVTHD